MSYAIISNHFTKNYLTPTHILNGMVASYQHEKELLEYLDELRSQGWKAVRLNSKSPDGIAVKDNRLVAIEIIIQNNAGKYYIDTNKRSDYSMFDEVFIRKIKKSKDRIIEKETNEYE